MKKFSSKNFRIYLLVICISAFSSVCNAQHTILGGTTGSGGAHGMGTIFSFDLSSNRDSVLWSFNGSDGEELQFSLTYLPSTHLFYGATTLGGSRNGGVLYSFDPAIDSVRVLYNSFGRNDAWEPGGDLVYDSSTGLLYSPSYLGGGSTYQGGSLFSFDPVTSAESVIWSFDNPNDTPAFPFGGLVYDAVSGLYYGTTQYGTIGTGTGFGALYTFDPRSGSVQYLWGSASDSDGYEPEGSVSFDPTSHICYFLTAMGGANDSGAVMSYDPASHVAQVVYSFGPGTDARDPQATLIYDTLNHVFYGISQKGGIYDKGTIFSFDPASGRDSVLWSFVGDSADGARPVGKLLYHPGSRIYYGITNSGGAADGGSIFSFNPASGLETLLWSFGGGTGDGGEPWADLFFFEYSDTAYELEVSAERDGARSAHATVSGGIKPYRYAWSNGQLTDTATGLIDGVVYTVTVTDRNDISSAASVSIPTGITPLSGNLPVSIYPDPVKDKLTIAGLQKGQTIAVYDCIGQRMCGATADGDRKTLDLTGVSAGIYFVQVADADGSLAARQRVVKE